MILGPDPFASLVCDELAAAVPSILDEAEPGDADRIGLTDSGSAARLPTMMRVAWRFCFSLARFYSAGRDCLASIACTPELGI
jgi:hypothetical protein